MFRKPRSKGFHESYYDHPCRTETERDVLRTNIRGVSWTTACKRKWYDLFLLSYSDERAGDFYHSTHAMRMERKRQFRLHRDCIHPLSKFRNYWDLFMLLVVFLHKILVFTATSVIFVPVPKAWHYVAVLLEVVQISDIYINTRTGFFDSTSHKVVLNRHLAVRHYCSTKLFFHTASAIPLFFLMFLRYGDDINCPICKANKFNCAISFFSTISIYRVYELLSYLKREFKTCEATAFFHFMRLGTIISLFVMQFLHLNDTVSLIVMMNTSKLVIPYENHSSFFDNIFVNMYIEKGVNFSDLTVVNAHFWRVINFLARPSFSMSHSYGSIYSSIHPHPLLKFIAYTILVSCTIWLLMEGFAFITRKRAFYDEVTESQQYLINLIKTRQLSEQLCLKIKQYFDYSAAKIKLTEKRNELYKSLPQYLKEELTWHSYGRLIKRIPYFADWPNEVVETLALSLKVHKYLKNEVLFEVGTPGDGLMIIEAGFLAVYSELGEELEHLIDGDYFGELSLVTDNEVITSSVVAISNCQVLILDKIKFRQEMRSHPHLFYWLQEDIKLEKTDPRNKLTSYSFGE